MHACGVHAHGGEVRLYQAYHPRTMYLAASQSYQPNKPGHCPSYLPAPYQIPRCMSALLPEESRSWNFIVTGGKGTKRRTRELRCKRFIRIAGLFEPSSGGDRSFPPTDVHLCSDSRRSRTSGSGRRIHCPRFNVFKDSLSGLFFHRPWIYYGWLEESIMSRVRDSLSCVVKFW